MKKLISILTLFVLVNLSFAQQTSYTPTVISNMWQGRVFPSATNIDSTFRAYLSKFENPVSVSTSSLTVTTSTVVVGVPSLSLDSVLAGHNYQFEAVLFCSAAGAGGFQVTMGGTCTATSMRYEVEAVNTINDSLLLSSVQTTLGGVTGSKTAQSAYTSVIYKIRGSIIPATSGTLFPKFAQAGASSTSSVNIGSYFKIMKAY